MIILLHRNDFIKGFVDVFYGEAIGECDAVELGDGQIVMIVTHNGIDAWFGDWIRFLKEIWYADRFF